MSKTYLWFKCYYATITKNSKSEQSDSREICRACYGCITLHKIERVMKMSVLDENTAVVLKESPENNLAANNHTLNNLKKMKRNLIIVGVIICVLMIAVGTIFIKGYVSATKKYKEKIAEKDAVIAELNKKIDELVEEPVVLDAITPEIVMDVMSTEIKGIGELATVNYLFTNAARFTDSKQIKNWNIPFTEKSFIVKWDGEIRAGVMVDEVEIVVDADEMKVTVYIPAAQIFSYSVTNAEVLDENNNIWNQITVDDKLKFDAKTEAEMRERAIQSGLLEEAQESAEEIIVKLFTANKMISEQYSIECQVK